MLRFVPPKLLAKYAVFIDHGNGRGFFRTYDDVGHAKVAFRQQAGYFWRGTTSRAGKILELVDGEWFTLYDIPEGTTQLPWQKDFGRDNGWGYRRSGIKTVPMSRDEYGEWRARVERERLEIVTVGSSRLSEKE